MCSLVMSPSSGMMTLGEWKCVRELEGWVEVEVEVRVDMDACVYVCVYA